MTVEEATNKALHSLLHYFEWYIHPKSRIPHAVSWNNKFGFWFDPSGILFMTIGDHKWQKAFSTGLDYTKMSVTQIFKSLHTYFKEQEVRGVKRV